MPAPRTLDRSSSSSDATPPRRHRPDRVRTLDERERSSSTSDAGLLDDRAGGGDRGGADGRPASSRSRCSPTSRTPCGAAIARFRIRSSRRSICAPIAAGRLDATPATRSPPDRAERWAARELQAAVGDHAHDGVLRLGGARPARRRARAEFRVAAIVPIDAGDRDLAPVYPGITDSPSLARLGSAVSDRSAPRAPGRRGVLGALSDDAEGVHPARGRPAALAVALRRADVDSRRRSPQRQVARRGSRADRRSACARAIDPLGDRASPCATCAPRGSRRRAAPPTSASTSSTSASSSSCPRCCWPRCSSSSASNSARARSDCCGRSASRRRRSGGCSWRRAAARVDRQRRSASSARSATPSLIMPALRTWWVDAVGTTALTLHVSRRSLAAGAVGGVVAAVVCIWWTLRSLRAHLRAESARRARLSRGRTASTSRERARRRTGPARCWPRSLLSLLGAALIAGAARRLDPADRRVLRRRHGAARRVALSLRGRASAAAAARARAGHGWRPVSRLGLRNATYRPGRSVLSMAVIASATFILISVDAFRRDGVDATDDPRLRRRRLRAAGRVAAADRPRSQHATRGARR